MSDGEPDWKFNEDKILKEVYEYVKATYKQHYAGQDGDIQTFEVIAKKSRLERGFHFATASGMKYLDRTPTKQGEARKDLMKAIHFGILALYCFDKIEENNRSTTVNETVSENQSNS